MNKEEYWKARCLAAEDVLNTLATPRSKALYKLWWEKHVKHTALFNSEPDEDDAAQSLQHLRNTLRALEYALKNRDVYE